MAPATYDAEPLLITEAMRVSLLTLAPGQYVPLHTHSDCTDHMFVVEGTLTVAFQGERPPRACAAGERCLIRPGVAHTTINRGASTCRFLLVQTGRYDFQPVAEQPLQ
jgi:quercetin dioxygenase-like cupin family protein